MYVLDECAGRIHVGHDVGTSHPRLRSYLVSGFRLVHRSDPLMKELDTIQSNVLNCFNYLNACVFNFSHCEHMLNTRKI